MKNVTIPKASLTGALSVASTADTNPKTSQTGVLITVTASRTLVRQQGETTTVVTVVPGAEATEEFTVHVPLNFNAIISSIPAKNITLTLQEKELEVSGGSAKAAFRLKDVTQFPAAREIPDNLVSLPAENLTAALEAVRFAASTDQARAILCGIRMSAGEGKIDMVATDSYRVSMVETDVATSDLKVDTVVPAAGAKALASMHGEVRFGIAEAGYIYASDGNVSVYLTPLAGEYPNVTRLIPEEFASTVTLDVASVKEVMSFISATSDVDSSVVVNATGLGVSMSPSKAGMDFTQRTSVDVEGSLEGEDIEFGVNPKYFKDALLAAGGETVKVFLPSPLKPMVIEGSNASLKQVVMPVRI
jgi:DNA polymerase III subunit beta